MRGVVNKKGQVWVETVIYTLIGLTIIGLVLAVALPKINEKKDEVMINQAVQALGSIDDKVYEVQRAVGNRRTVDLDIGKGRLIIDMDLDTISWVIDSKFKYSEPGIEVPMGNLNVLTEETDPWTVTLKINYAVDIRFDELSVGTKELDSAPTPYKLMIENIGKNEFDNLIIQLSVS
ncbi:MAG: hypothetical protein KKF50_03035 [Nanoarchaeota archaeon]|nr:hypothetical protein [Nanoarchaeota archaeon]